MLTGKDKQCVVKRGFETKSAAKRELRRMLTYNTRHHEKELLRVYKCPHCPYWHLGRDRS